MPEPVVVIGQGILRGRIAKNINNEDYYSFQGVPYAKPPLGNLRFKAPLPPEPWIGILDATKERNRCFARDFFLDGLAGSEDCLFLNVFTRTLPSRNVPISRPVMVWIHGGAFVMGSSKEELYGPQFLLTEDIVLVTFNYRLGILGFFNLEDSTLDVPGNAGMKDMVMVLRWVQDNIDSFGGDPDNVTIFGESAGGVSVHLLVLSSMAKRLFHKAIAQSGCAINIFNRHRQLALKLAEALNLPTRDEKEVLKHLQSLPIEKLHEVSEKIDVSGEHLIRRYGPIIEESSPKAFISEEPIEIINSGQFNKVSMIFGYCSREGMLQEMMEILTKSAKPEMPSDFEVFVPRYLGLQKGSDASKEIAEKIKQFYYGKTDSEKDIDNFYLVYGDAVFLKDIHISTIRHSQIAPTYLYRISVESKLNVFKVNAHIIAPGVCHGDDIGYLFKNKTTSELTKGSLEEVSVKRFVKIWTNFAKTGDPNSEDLGVRWKPVKKDEINFIDIGEELTVDINPESNRIKFWEEILSINQKYKI